jgi:O-antigen/teichoic acid export membrane protein
MPVNVLANWAGFAVGFLVNFFLSPLIVHHLGASAYGVWALLGTLTAYLGLLDLGIRSAVTRYVARSQSRGDHEMATQVVSTALAVFAALAGLALVASAVLGLVAPSIFRIPAEYRATTQIVAVLAGASTAIALMNGAFGGVIVGLQRFDLSCGVDVATALVRAALVLGVIAMDGGLVGLAGAQLLASLAGALGTAWVGWRLYPGLHLRPTWSRLHLRLIASYGGYTFVGQFAASIVDRASVIILGLFLPMAAVAIFAIAAGLIDHARALVGGIRTTLAPQASALEGRGQREALRELALQGARYCTLLAVPLAATLALRGASFIGLWMGAAYGEPSGAVLAVLAIRLVFLGATGAGANVMLGASRERAVAGAHVVQAAVSVATMLLLVRPFGLSGVAWGTTGPAVAAALLLWPWLMRQTFGVGFRDYVDAAWARPVAAHLPFIAMTWAVERWWPASSLPVFIVQVVALMPLALLGVWLVGLSAAERRQGLALVRVVPAVWRSGGASV